MEIQYAPLLPKKQEKRLFAGLLLLSVALIAASLIPSVWAPHLMRALAAISLFTSAMIYSRCLMRRYVYRVELCTADEWGTSYDFTVTEYTGARGTVVCRLAVSNVESAVRLTAENRRSQLADTRGCSVYTYTGTLFPTEEYLLKAWDGEKPVYLKILASELLINRLLTP